MERAAEDTRKYEHSCHSKDILERQDDVLAKWKLLVDADVEDLLRPGTGSMSHACHIGFFPSKACFTFGLTSRWRFGLNALTHAFAVSPSFFPLAGGCRRGGYIRHGS